MTRPADLERARTALHDHDWQAAYEGFASSTEDELGADDLERLAEAAWWSAHPAESLDAFEHAYRAYVDEGNKRRAAAIAIRLAMEYADRSEMGPWRDGSAARSDCSP